MTAATHTPSGTAPASVEFALLQSWLASGRSLQLPLHEIECQQQIRGREVQRLLLQAHLQQRGNGDVGPALYLPQDGEVVAYSHRRLGARSLTTVFGTVELVRMGYKDAAPAVKFSRLRPPASSRVFLIEGAVAVAFQSHPDLARTTVGYCKAGRLFRANSGRERKHFPLCRFCGRALDKAGDHETPWGSRCKGGRVIVDLVCQFTTETLQIRFETAPEVTNRSFWTSFTSALVAAAADVLSIPRSDLDATYRSQTEGSLKGELVIYDRVPGGAGYVFQVRDKLRIVLLKTLERVANCANPNCDLQSSCYTCLRTYRNQFEWEDLSRQIVVDWLSTIV